MVLPIASCTTGISSSGSFSSVAYLELSGIPMNIYKAYTCAEAYMCIEQVGLDLILLDVMLPDGSGYDVCRHLKGFRLYQNIPVIILTALNDKQSMLEGLKAGAYNTVISNPAYTGTFCGKKLFCSSVAIASSLCSCR